MQFSLGFVLVLLHPLCKQIKNKKPHSTLSFYFSFTVRINPRLQREICKTSKTIRTTTITTNKSFVMQTKQKKITKTTIIEQNNLLDFV